MINDFFMNSIWGIIVLSIIGSILATLLSKGVSRLYSIIIKHFKKKKRVKYLVESGVYFGLGSKTAYAKEEGSFHQALLVGHLLKDIITEIGVILFEAIVALVLIVVFRNYWLSLPIIITICSFVVSIEYRKLKNNLLSYDTVFKYVYGDEYYKSEMDGIKEYWDSITKQA